MVSMTDLFGGRVTLLSWGYTRLEAIHRSLPPPHLTTSRDPLMDAC